MSTIQIDPERQKLAKARARIQNRLSLVELALGGIYVLAWLVTGWSIELRNWLGQFTDQPWLSVAGFALVFGGIYFIITLPFSFYEGFIIPHRYKLSTETVSAWTIDLLKGMAIGIPIGLLLLELVYLLLRVAPQSWWLWAAGAMLLFSVVMANLAPVVLLPLFNKFTPLGEGHAELEKRLTALARKANTPVLGVFKFDMSRRSTTANAALTGLGNTRRIILGDTLLERYSADEIETILAHELGHQVHQDIPWGILVGSLLTLTGFYLAGLGLEWGVAYFGFSGPADVAAMPLFVLVMGIYGLITMPLENNFSRWRERRADQYALQMTGNGKAFGSALVKLADQNLSDADPEPWVEFFLYSHPALGKRIRAAETYSSSQQEISPI